MAAELKRERQQLEREFRAVGDTPPKDPAILDSCIHLSKEMGLSAEQFCNKWTSYALQSNKNGAPGMDDIESFRNHLLKNRVPVHTKYEQSLLQPMEADDTAAFMTTDDFFNLQSYGIEDIKVHVKKNEMKKETQSASENAVESAFAKQRTGLLHELMNEIAKTDELWQSRTDRSKVEAQYGTGADASKFVHGFVPVKIVDSRTQEASLRENRRYMFEDVPSIQSSIRNRIRRYEPMLLSHVKEKPTENHEMSHGDPEAFHTISTTSQLAVGKLRVELEDRSESTLLRTRINAKSTLLENAEGATVKLDLQHINTGLVVAPGQIVAVEGVNDGHQMTVAGLYDDIFPVASESDAPAATMEIEPVSGESLIRVVVATGPFTTSGACTYKPLEDLLSFVQENNPSALILAGPFVEARCYKKEAKREEILPEEIFTGIVLRMVNDAVRRMDEAGNHMQCFIVPHINDSFGHMVVPQPPFDLAMARDLGYQTEFSNIRFASNPTTLSIGGTNGATIGITSLPVLEDISAECMVLGAAKDRLSAICDMVVKQSSFYPLFPPSANIPLDTTHYDRLDFPEDGALDVLIIPSRLKVFASEVSHRVVCVNPGSLCKYDRTGTFAEIVFDSSNTRNKVKSARVLHI